MVALQRLVEKKHQETAESESALVHTPIQIILIELMSKPDLGLRGLLSSCGLTIGKAEHAKSTTGHTSCPRIFVIRTRSVQKAVDHLTRSDGPDPSSDIVIVILDNLDEKKMERLIATGAEDAIDFEELSGSTLRRAICAAKSRRTRPTTNQDTAASNPITLVQETADAMVILDQDGRVQFANDAAERLLNQSAADLHDRPFPFLVKAGGPTDVDIVLPDGSVKMAEYRSVETEWGDLPARVVTLADVTMRKKLEKLVQQMSDAANTDQTLLFSTLSHRLRTPLNDIVGFSDLLRGEMVQSLALSKISEYGQDIYASGLAIRDIIDDFLGDVGNDQYDSLGDDICDIAELVTLSVQKMDRNQDASRRRIVVDCAPDLPSLKVDAGRLREDLFRTLRDAIANAFDNDTISISVTMTEQGVAISMRGGWRDLSDQDLAGALEPSFDIAENVYVADTHDQRLQRTGAVFRRLKKTAEIHGGAFGILANHDDGLTIRLVFPLDRSGPS